MHRTRTSVNVPCSYCSCSLARKLADAVVLVVGSPGVAVVVASDVTGWICVSCAQGGVGRGPSASFRLYCGVEGLLASAVVEPLHSHQDHRVSSFSVRLIQQDADEVMHFVSSHVIK